MLDTLDHGTIRELRFNRPPANALVPEILFALRDAVDRAPGEGVEALVLSGSPGMFSAGLDVPALLGRDRAGIHELWTSLYGAMRALASSPVPVACAITGHSPAGGAVLSLFCDRRFMAAGKFKIGLNEVRIGLVLPPMLHTSLARLVGDYQAGRLLTEGLMILPEEAHRLGWVDAVVEVEEVVPTALAWCRGLLTLPRRAMLHSRQIARSDLADLVTASGGIVDHLTDAWFSPETQAGLQALVASLKKE